MQFECQYSEAWVKIQSSLNTADRSGPWSLQAQYFSASQASSPAGESDRP